VTDVDCEFKDKCTSFPDWCGTCQRNKAKRNYYIPQPYPQPYWPWYPFYPYPFITVTINSGPGSYYIPGCQTT